MPRPAYALLALMIACGGGDDDDDGIPDQVLSGFVGGDAWVFAQGQVERIGQATGNYDVGLYGEAFDECARSNTTEFLLTSFAPEVGSYPFDLNQNLTFVVDEGGPVNKVATDGLLVIESITQDTVRGRLRARFDSGNDVAGSFEISTCIAGEAPVTFEPCSFDTAPPTGTGDAPAVQRIAAAADGRAALIDATGTVLSYVPASGTGCSLLLADTPALPSPATAIDYDAAGLLYIHTADALYRYDGATETLACTPVGTADGLGVAPDGAVAYSKFVNSASRITIGATNCAGAVWTPANAFAIVHDVAAIDDWIFVGGRLNDVVQVVAFDDAGAEQVRFGAADQLTRADGIGRCGQDYCLLNSSFIAVYDASGDLVGTSNLADLVTVEAGFEATDLAFPPGGGAGYLGVSAQRLGSLDTEPQIYRVTPDS